MNSIYRPSRFKTILGAVFFSILALPSLAQKPFVGVLEYKISARDTSFRNVLPDNIMLVYTNDTIVRTENFTNSFGKQVMIRHISMNKSYLLLDTPLGKFALPTDHSEKNKDSSSVSKYHFKTKLFKKKVIGMKANKVIATHPDFNEAIEFLYFKRISGKYLNIFEELKGLPVRYSVPTADGILDYELIRMNEYTPNNDLFGVPSDYERISFDDFMNKMLNKGEETPIIHE